MPWQFIVSDLKGVDHGEVTQASARTVTLPHLRVPSASFTMPLWHALGPTIMDTDCLLKCYRIDPITGLRSLAFHGPIVSAEETGEVGNQTIAVTAAGPYWRLTKRLIPASTNPDTGWSYGSAANLQDLGTMARVILQDTNAEPGGFTGIDLGTHTASASGWVSKWYNKNAAEAIAELAAGLSSFEFRVRPTEATAYANAPYDWPRIGLFDVAPVLGVSRPDAVFEYGTTRANVQGYTRAKTRDGLLTRAVLSVQGWPDSVERDAANVRKYNQIEREDAAAILSRGLFEEVVNDAGILADDGRAKIGDYHVLLRKQPREIITFRPSVNARPAPFVDYEVGDTVRARAVVRGSLRFDALFRIWGVTFNVDENGNENVDLELVQP